MATRPTLAATWLIALLAAAGPALAQSSPSPFTMGYRYDPAGEETGVILPDPDGAGPLPFPAVRKSYDPAGRLVKVEEGRLAAWQSEAVAPAAWSGFIVDRTTATAWDAMDRKLRDTVSGSDGAAVAATDYSYDAAGRLLCTAVRMNPASWGAGPVDACTATAPGSGGPDRIARNSYDSADQLLKVEKGVTTPLRQDYATYDYDLDGRRTAVVDANGNRAELRYDGLGRENCWIFPSKTTAGAVGGDCATGDFEAYGYDVAGDRTSLRKRDGTTLTYTYDALGRMTQKSVPLSASGAAGYAVFYAYDLRGLETEARFGSAAGPGVTNAYDGFGRLAASTTNMDGTARTFTSSYDAESNRTRLAISSGYVMNWTFDGLDRMAGLLDGNNEQLVRITYDPAGRRQGLALGPGGASAAAYGYDPAGRLQSLAHDLGGGAFDQALTFAYNPASQIVTRTASNDGYASNTAQAVSRPYSVNGLNQYTAAGPATFAYDANGNLTSDGTNTFVYDAENRLVSASGAHDATLSYDPLGRLWQVTAPSGTTRFTYDGDRLTEEYNGSGQWVRLYAHGPGADEPLVWYELTGGPVRRYLHADHQGSVIASADDAGNVVGLAGYDAWGIPNSTSLTNVGRLGYTGQAWLPELGMWYYKARLYSPTLGRFLQTDPVGYKDEINLYAYVHDDPVNGVDPSGELGLDLMHDPNDRRLNEMAEISGVYTISAHAAGAGVRDDRSGGDPHGAPRYNPKTLYRVAFNNRGSPYRRGMTTLLLACEMGLLRMPGSDKPFAQDYANESGGDVIASPDFTHVVDRGGLAHLETLQGKGWYRYTPGGKTATYLGKQIIVNPRTGKAVISDDPETGSRIRHSEVKCVDPQKCGEN